MRWLGEWEPERRGWKPQQKKRCSPAKPRTGRLQEAAPVAGDGGRARPPAFSARLYSPNQKGIENPFPKTVFVIRRKGLESACATLRIRRYGQDKPPRLTRSLISLNLEFDDPNPSARLRSNGSRLKPERRRSHKSRPGSVVAGNLADGKRLHQQEYGIPNPPGGKVKDLAQGNSADLGPPSPLILTRMEAQRTVSGFCHRV